MSLSACPECGGEVRLLLDEEGTWRPDERPILVCCACGEEVPPEPPPRAGCDSSVPCEMVVPCVVTYDDGRKSPPRKRREVRRG